MAKPDQSASQSELRSQEVGEYLIREYISAEGKKREIAKFERADVEGLATMISWFSFSSQEELDAVRDQEDFQGLCGLARLAFQTGSFPDKLLQIARDRRWRLILSIFRTRRKLEDRLLAPHSRDLARITCRTKLRSVRQRLLSNRLSDRKNAAHAGRHAALGNVLDSISAVERVVLNENALRLTISNRDPAELLAYAILHPENAIPELQELSEHWETYPLKWHALRLPIDQGRVLFRRHTLGEDLANFFFLKYSAGAADVIGTIRAIRGVPLFRERRESISETLSAYDQGLYRASLCLTLTIVEGVLWDFARELHRKYPEMTPTPSTAWRIRDLLESPHMKEELDESFIRYFCDELYPERNPTLHGRVRDTGHQVQAAQKLATLEYLLNVVGEWLTKDILERLPAADPSIFREIDSFLESYEPSS